MTTLSDPQNWVTEHGDYLYRYALMRVRDASLAEDLVQETFLAALRARDNFSGKSTEKTWLVGILKHKIVDQLYRSKSGLQVEDIEAMADIWNDNFDQKGHWKSGFSAWSAPDLALERDKFWEVFQRCIENLPPRLAQAFLLKEMDGLSGEELCKALDISTTNNVWVMLSRARMRLRDCLDTNWFGYAEVSRDDIV